MCPYLIECPGLRTVADAEGFGEAGTAIGIEGCA
jgi:hypothetical protein